jgi:hypothetical protein
MVEQEDVPGRPGYLLHRAGRAGLAAGPGTSRCVGVVEQENGAGRP